MDKDNKYKYFAFISYNSKDQKWGKKLQRKLERFKLPSTLCNERNLERKPIKPVFFAPTDIQPGGLNEELQDRLKASKYLIVICSPNSAKSEWVGKEIEYFAGLGRADHIQFFIVDGVPHSGDPKTECFNPVTEKIGLPEILGANVNEKVHHLPWLNEERAYVQLISKLLGVEFDSIWNRHKRHAVNRLIAWCIGVLLLALLIIGIIFFSRPVDVKVHLNEASLKNENLPALENIIVTMTLDNEIKSDSVLKAEDGLIFSNIPPKEIGKEIRITAVAKNFIPLDTIVVLSKETEINLYRDPDVYGNVVFRFWDPDKEKPVEGIEVEIAGQDTTSDQEGYVRLTIPLALQQESYEISANVKMIDNILYMPCNESTVILVE